MAKLLHRYNLLNKIIRNHLFTTRQQTCSQKILTVQPLSEPKEDSDILSYVDKSDEYKVGINSATCKLEQLFGMKKCDIAKVISKNTFLLEVPGIVMSDNYKLCRQNGIRDETILSCLYLLAERYLFEKVYMLQQLNYDLNILTPLVKINTLALNTVIKNGGLLERISFFSNLLKVSEFLMCEYMVKREFLFTINMEKAEVVCKLLYEHGVSNEEILNDLWIIRYSNYIMKERIEYIKSQNVEKLKTWMIRANKDTFDKHIQRKSENKSVLGDQTLAEYISERFDCSLHQAKGLVMKYPAFENRRLKQLQGILELLHINGFMPTDIFCSPKILFFNVNTIKNRLNLVKGYDLQSIGLHVFAKSRKQFNEYYEDVIKNKKNKRKKSVVIRK